MIATMAHVVESTQYPYKTCSILDDEKPCSDRSYINQSYCFPLKANSPLDSSPFRVDDGFSEPSDIFSNNYTPHKSLYHDRYLESWDEAGRASEQHDIFESSCWPSIETPLPETEEGDQKPIKSRSPTACSETCYGESEVISSTPLKREPTSREAKRRFKIDPEAHPSPSPGRKPKATPSNRKRQTRKKPLRKITRNSEDTELHKRLDELTQDSDEALRDTYAWVHRSEEQRHNEVKDRSHIPRPMNGFFLYKAAQKKRAKEWLIKEDNQCISAWAGDKWHLESQETRDKYNALAKIESEEHRMAFPNYKFTPGKGSGPKRKRKASPEDGTGDPSNAEADATPQKSRKRRESTHPPDIKQECEVEGGNILNKIEQSSTWPIRLPTSAEWSPPIELSEVIEETSRWPYFVHAEDPHSPEPMPFVPKAEIYPPILPFEATNESGSDLPIPFREQFATFDSHDPGEREQSIDPALAMSQPLTDPLLESEEHFYRSGIEDGDEAYVVGVSNYFEQEMGNGQHE